MRFTRERLWLVSNSEINQVSSGFLGQLEFVSLCSHRWSFAGASAAPADVRSPLAVDPLASPVVATSGSLLLSRSILRTVAGFCCSFKDRAPLRNISWSRVPRQQQSWPWTDGLHRDDHERPIRPVLCCTEGAVQKQPHHPKEPPGHTRRCAESVPAVQVFPLQLATLDLSLSPASLRLVILKLGLMPASLTSRSTRSIPALPGSPYITQANMKICSRSPHLSKNPSLQWNCCVTCSASPLPPSYPTAPSLTMADTRVGLSMVPKGPRKCEEFRCSCNSIKLKACPADTFMSANSMSRHNCLWDNFRRF